MDNDLLNTKHKFQIRSTVFEVLGLLHTLFYVCEFESLTKLDCTNVLFYMNGDSEFIIPRNNLDKAELNRSYKYTNKKIAGNIVHKIYNLHNKYFTIINVESYWYTVKFE